MRETRNAQTSIFDFYSKHELGKQLHQLSDLLDQNPEILQLIEKDLRTPQSAFTGANGLSVESVFRCLLLKQIHHFTYVQLAFHLAYSHTYRAIVRLRQAQYPGRSSLQACVRSISDQTLESINQLLMKEWVSNNTLSLESMRIDSTVLESNITPPVDSQLLNQSSLQKTAESSVKELRLKITHFWTGTN